jgi:hypothetical protein
MPAELPNRASPLLSRCPEPALWSHRSCPLTSPALRNALAATLRTSAMGCWSGFRRRAGLGRLRYVMMRAVSPVSAGRRLKLLTCKVPTTQDTV